MKEVLIDHYKASEKSKDKDKESKVPLKKLINISSEERKEDSDLKLNKLIENISKDMTGSSSKSSRHEGH